MKKSILIATLIIMSISLPAFAQSVSLVFGPLEGDSAGTIVADHDDLIEVEVWARTAAGFNIVGLHLPLSSNNLYIRSNSRAGGTLHDPLDEWSTTIFTEPDNDRFNDGYVNQSLLGIKDPPGFPGPANGINTEGEWWLIAGFHMNVEDDADYGVYHDVFTTGESQCSGRIALIDYLSGALSPEQYELIFASLQITGELESDDEEKLPAEFSLSQNYPNPFNASTTIRYDLPGECDVSIWIFDLLGARIATLVNRRQPAGRHSVTWDSGRTPSGIYFYKIYAGNFSKTMRSVLIK